MQYIIRKKAYSYDNRIHFPKKCSSGVHSIYSSLSDAQEAKLELEKYLFKSGIGFSQVHYHPIIRQKVATFFEKEFGLNIWANTAKSYLEAPVWLPQNHNDIQLLELIDIMGVSFFEIVKKETPTIFYRPIVNADILKQYFPTPTVDELSKLDFYIDEYDKGFAMCNSIEEAFEFGCYELINNFKNSHFIKVALPSPMSQLVELVNKCKVDFEMGEIYFKDTQEKAALYQIVKELDIIQYSEHKLWDTMYDCLELYEEEMRYQYDGSDNSLHSLSLEYGIPDFLIKMKLEGELEEEDFEDEF